MYVLDPVALYRDPDRERLTRRVFKCAKRLKTCIIVILDGDWSDDRMKRSKVEILVSLDEVSRERARVIMVTDNVEAMGGALRRRFFSISASSHFFEI
jgi:ATP-dependent 26S proteasome regulatory subunit